MSWTAYTTRGRHRVCPITCSSEAEARGHAERWERNLIAAGYEVTRRTKTAVYLRNENRATTIRVIMEPKFDSGKS